MLDRLAAFLHRRSRRVALAALLITAVCGAIGGPVAGLLSGGGFADPHSPSAEASAQMARATGIDPEEGVVALVRPGSPITSSAGQAELRHVAAQFVGLLLALDTSTRLGYLFTARATVDGRELPSDIASMSAVLGGATFAWGVILAASSLALCTLGLWAAWRRSGV